MIRGLNNLRCAVRNHVESGGCAKEKVPEKFLHLKAASASDRAVWRVCSSHSFSSGKWHRN